MEQDKIVGISQGLGGMFGISKSGKLYFVKLLTSPEDNPKDRVTWKFIVDSPLIDHEGKAVE